MRYRRRGVALGSWVLALALGAGAGGAPAAGGFPTRGWPVASPESVGLDSGPLAALDADIAAGRLGLIDSVDVFRCGEHVYTRIYAHDYATIYGREARVRGPLNARLTGPYNYFDPRWHPYYHGTGLHSMQSVSKTVTSVIYGIAIGRGDFRAGLDTPVLHWFDVAKVRHVDERKRRLTLRHVLTMTTGREWTENVPYDDPRSDSSLMEATDDWVRYVIDKPMAEEPGRRFNYSSGATELLAEIFRRETGQDIEAYARRHLFEPLGIRYHWKRTYLGLVDTEGGLYLSGPDLAKIGLLYLRGGEWEGRQVVPADWVRQSVAPYIATGDEGEPFQYGFKWWLYTRPDNGRIVWMARGFGGQRLMVFPEEGLIATVTGWEIIKEPPATGELVGRLVKAVTSPACPGSPH